MLRPKAAAILTTTAGGLAIAATGIAARRHMVTGASENSARAVSLNGGWSVQGGRRHVRTVAVRPAVVVRAPSVPTHQRSPLKTARNRGNRCRPVPRLCRQGENLRPLAPDLFGRKQREAPAAKPPRLARSAPAAPGLFADPTTDATIAASLATPDSHCSFRPNWRTTAAWPLFERCVVPHPGEGRRKLAGRQPQLRVGRGRTRRILGRHGDERCRHRRCSPRANRSVTVGGRAYHRHRWIRRA